MASAARRGVDVRLLLPRTSNHVVADWLSRGYFGQLLAAGVRILRFQDAMVHAKTATIDGSWSTVGTANIDRLSMTGNYEINVELIDAAFAAEMERIFATDLVQLRRAHRPRPGPPGGSTSSSPSWSWPRYARCSEGVRPHHRCGQPPDPFVADTSSSPSEYHRRITFLSNLPTEVRRHRSMKAQASGSCHFATDSARKSRSSAGADGRSLAEHDRGQWALLPLLVGDADDGRLDDVGVRHQRVLQVNGGDPLAART